MGFAGYVTKQAFVSSRPKCQVVNVEECVTQAAFESFTEEGITACSAVFRLTILLLRSADTCRPICDQDQKSSKINKKIRCFGAANFWHRGHQISDIFVNLGHEGTCVNKALATVNISAK